MTTIRAIETHYKGYRFRSRLEARWAICFDALRIPWEYEAQGYETNAGPYLPDFILWQALHAEVKPPVVAGDTIADAWPKASAFASSGQPIALLLGAPAVDWFPVLHLSTDKHRTVYPEWIDFGQSAREGRPWYAYQGRKRPPQSDLTSADRFLAAVFAARAARFEHGESGPEVVPSHTRRQKSVDSKVAFWINRQKELQEMISEATTDDQKNELLSELNSVRQQLAELRGR